MSNEILDMRFVQRTVPDYAKNIEAGFGNGQCLYEKEVSILQFRYGRLREIGIVTWNEWSDVRTEEEELA